MLSTFDISDRLKALRAAAELTQEEFAEHAGIDYKFYQHIESGRKKLLRVDTVERICKGYGIELWEFFAPKIPKIHVKLRKRYATSSRRRTSRAAR